MRANWQTRAVAILMGCLVGPYTGLFPSLVFAVIVSALVLAIPALTSVLIDPALAHRTATLVSVGVCALLVGSLLVAGAAFPAVWQGYSSDAPGISLLAEMLLTPFVAAFIVIATRPQGEGSSSPEKEALICAVLAWVGIGLHNVLLPYVLPLAARIITALSPHPPLHRGGLGEGFQLVTAAYVLVYLGCVYAIGFGLVSIEGRLAAALRGRLTRHPATIVPTGPAPV